MERDLKKKCSLWKISIIYSVLKLKMRIRKNDRCWQKYSCAYGLFIQYNYSVHLLAASESHVKISGIFIKCQFWRTSGVGNIIVPRTAVYVSGFFVGSSVGCPFSNIAVHIKRSSRASAIGKWSAWSYFICKIFIAYDIAIMGGRGITFWKVDSIFSGACPFPFISRA